MDYLQRMMEEIIEKSVRKNHCDITIGQSSDETHKARPLNHLMIYDV